MKDSTLVKNKDSLELTPHDVALLEDILGSGIEYIANESFSDKDLCKRLLDYKGPEVDSSWFFNHLNSLDGIDVDGYTDRTQLSAKEEKLLFLKFNYLKKKIDAMAKLNLPQTYHEIIELHAEVERVKEQIAGANLAFVVSFANNNTFTHLDFSDVLSEGSLALNKAIDKFDVGLGYKFSTYLHRAISTALIKEDKKNSKHANNVEYDNSKHDRAEEEDVSVNNEMFALIRDLVDGDESPLTEEQKFVVGKKYYEGLTLEQIGQLMTPTRTKGQVFYIEKIAKDKLRKALDDLL